MRPEPPFTGVSLRTLRARNRKKVSKKVFLGVRRKVPKNTRKSLKIPKKVRKSVFFDFSGYFLRLFCGPPKRPFLRLFCDFGPGKSGDSCKWRLGSPSPKVHYWTFEVHFWNPTALKTHSALMGILSSLILGLSRRANTKKEDKRATTNVQHGLVFFFLFSFILFSYF